MFAPSFARLVRSTTAVSATPAAPLCRAALGAATKPLHQRRYSSSKSSIPPSNKKKPVEELEQNAATQLQGPKSDAKPRDKAMQMPFAMTFNAVPHVPATTHLHEDDVQLSSFFAMHRPIPFHREAWQQSANMDAFEALFDQAKLDNVHSIQRTKSTLSEFVQRIWATMDAQDEMQDSTLYMEEPQAAAGPPTEESIRSHASRLPHFIPPPPPIAFDPFAPTAKPLTAEEVNQRITEVALPSAQAGQACAFREHVHRRRRGMLLISVKRQRKLKMKKHKYKKLMKRTRLERRKLDRT
ncbi:hypothetical protein ACEQ8H_002424 [Pleosporales sp. CAS-2024a]